MKPINLQGILIDESVSKLQTENSLYCHWTISDDELKSRVLANEQDVWSVEDGEVISIQIDPTGFLTNSSFSYEGEEVFGRFDGSKNPRKVFIEDKQPAEKVWLLIRYDGNYFAGYPVWSIVSVNTGDQPLPYPDYLRQFLGKEKEVAALKALIESIRKSAAYWGSGIHLCPKYVEDGRIYFEDKDEEDKDEENEEDEEDKKRFSDIDAGDLYLDCNHCPNVCIDSYFDSVEGLSLIEGMPSFGCNLYACCPEKITEDIAIQYIMAYLDNGQRGLMKTYGWKDEGIDDFMKKWRPSKNE